VGEEERFSTRTSVKQTALGYEKR